MNFEHTDDRRMLADSLNRFIAEQYAFDKRDRIAKSAHGFSPEIWQQFAELGAEPLHTDYSAAPASQYFNLSKLSIFGGSNEIQRNIISKMILGL